MINRYLLGSVLAIALASGAYAESLSERRAARAPKVEETKIDVACGKLAKENCAIVVPEINARSVQSNVRLQPLESQGSVESLNGLCDGDVEIAVVQEDVLARRSAQPDCTGKLATLGSPDFPYQGYMVVSNKRKDSSFADMIGALGPGKVLHIAAGGSGSGGEYTLRMVLDKHPEWRNRVSIESDGADTALSKIQDNVLDAFFVMDGPHSPFLDTVKDTVDQKDNKPVFKFVDFTPDDAVLSYTYGMANLSLYAVATLSSGFWSSTKTIATPAVIAIRNDWYKANATVAKIIRQANEDALPNIAARAGANPDWRKEMNFATK